MLFKVLSYFKRKREDQPRRLQDRRLSSDDERAQWDRIHREREMIERRLRYLEAQASVLARRDQ